MPARRLRVPLLAGLALVLAAPALRAQHAGLGLATGADAPVALTGSVVLGKGWALRGAASHTTRFETFASFLATRAGGYPDTPGARTTRLGGQLTAAFHRPLGRGVETYVGPYAALAHRVERATVAAPFGPVAGGVTFARRVSDVLEAGAVLGLDVPVVGRLRAHGEGRVGFQRARLDRPSDCLYFTGPTDLCTGRETEVVLDAVTPRFAAGLTVRLGR